jgi:hypothetical protein
VLINLINLIKQHTLAADTARMMAVGLVMKLMTMSRIRLEMSFG